MAESQKKEKCSGWEFLGQAVYLVPVPKRPKELNAGRLRVGVRRTSNNRGKNMKNWAMLLACGMVAFAIGCGDGGAAKPSSNTEADKAKAQEAMKAMMEKGGPGATALAGDAAAPAGDASEKKDPDAEKKDAPAEEKKDAPAEEKKDAPAEEKKE